MADLLPLKEYAGYVCPSCKGPLEIQPHALCCPTCSRSYPITDRIPDFLAPGVDQIPHANPPDPLVQRMDRADRGALKWMSGLYEGVSGIP